MGVFAVKVRLGRKFYRGICNIGFRPTINTIQSVIPLVEVHILDFKGSIYGRRMEVFFCDKIRSESKFDSLDALKKQLAQDKKTASALIDWYYHQKHPAFGGVFSVRFILGLIVPIAV